jgi:hypothetical protein
LKVWSPWMHCNNPKLHSSLHNLIWPNLKIEYKPNLCKQKWKKPKEWWRKHFTSNLSQRCFWTLHHFLPSFVSSLHHSLLVFYRCSKSSPTFHCMFNYLMCGLHRLLVILDCECYCTRYATTPIHHHNVFPLSVISLMKNLTSTSYSYNTPSTSRTSTSVYCLFFSKSLLKDILQHCWKFDCFYMCLLLQIIFNNVMA